MRVQSLLTLVLLTTLALPARAQTRTPVPRTVDGTWLVGIVQPGDTMWMSWTLRADGDSVRGDMSPRAPNSLHGVLRRDSIELVQRWDSVTVRARFRAQWRDGRFVGAAIARPRGSTTFPDTAGWIVVPVAQRSGPPRRVDFEPTVFHRTFSGAATPALRIFPGDTVATRTIDAGGTDWSGRRRWAGGNPQTGPFFIEGVMPGDVLAIRLHRVRLNRDTAFAGTGIVPNALTPEFARAANGGERADGRWILDRARGVARLASPSPALARFEIPLRPQLGTVAVAPARGQAFRTQDSGEYGGNMDYNALGEGTTIYLTANVPGGLVFIGDGHAAQGDGELTGDALETSMDVAFSVEVMRGMSPGDPRAESATDLMAIGIAGDLTTALQRATSTLASWLMQRHGLSASDAAAVLGTSMRYDVADLVGTQVSIVAKVATSVTARLGVAR
jgi:amidase